VKYTIEGFSQVKLIEYGLNYKHVLLLKYIQTCCSLSKMHRKTFNDMSYTWVKYDGFLNEYPFLDIPNSKQVGVYVKQLQVKGLIKLEPDRTPLGVFTYIMLTDKFLSLSSSNVNNYIPSAENDVLHDDLIVVAGEKIVVDSKKNRSGNEVKSETYINNNPSTIIQSTIIHSTINQDNIFNEQDFTNDEITQINKFLKYKKEKKQSYTKTGLEGLHEQLLEFKTKNYSIIEIIKTSISRNYSGLFEPKNQFNNNTSKTIQQTLKYCNANFVESKDF